MGDCFVFVSSFFPRDLHTGKRLSVSHLQLHYVCDMLPGIPQSDAHVPYIISHVLVGMCLYCLNTIKCMLFEDIGRRISMKLDYTTKFHTCIVNVLGNVDDITYKMIPC